MKYSTEITIKLPRDRVIELFDSAENLYKWQEGLLSLELLEGKAGHEGAVSKMVYASRKNDLVMTETIASRKFPEEYTAIYKAKGVHNVVNNHFIASTPDQTTWKIHNEFRFRGMMALMAPFMKSAFEANTVLSMERFKLFAEQSHR